MHTLEKRGLDLWWFGLSDAKWTNVLRSYWQSGNRKGIYAPYGDPQWFYVMRPPAFSQFTRLQSCKSFLFSTKLIPSFWHLLSPSAWNVLSALWIVGSFSNLRLEFKCYLFRNSKLHGTYLTLSFFSLNFQSHYILSPPLKYQLLKS